MHLCLSGDWVQRVDLTNLFRITIRGCSSETDDHVNAKAVKYLGPQITAEIVVVLLLRSKSICEDRLKMLMYARGRNNSYQERA